MPTIDTSTLSHFDYSYGEQLYCGLDTAATLEVAKALEPQVPRAQTIYDFERALQAPMLEMMLTGFLVDKWKVKTTLEFLGEGWNPKRKVRPEGWGEIGRLSQMLNRMAFAVWDRPLNPNSQKQLLEFFYHGMNIPEIWSFKKGERKLSMDRDTLEKIEEYFYARPIARTVLAIRDLEKQAQVVSTEIDLDGRFRSSFNIAGTETGRLSSSSSSLGTGGNLQNLSPKVREIFISDPGRKFLVIDLEQAESREVGWLCGVLFGDWSYYDAALSGDLHTTACKLIWPNLGWPGDAKGDRAIADQAFYREFSYRDMSKRGGHASNYFGKPATVAKHLKVQKKLIEDFQVAYFSAFPGIPLWHSWVASELQTKQALTTIFGRTRHFFDRSWDDTTLRAAIAFSPQSATAERMNLILWRIWKRFGGRVWLHAQVHDALYLSYDEGEDEVELAEAILREFHIDISHPSGRTLKVPGEPKVGWNLGNWSPKNPDGLKKLKGRDERTRTPPLAFLDRPL